MVSRAIRNVQRGYQDDGRNRGMFRPEIKLDLQRSRLMTESFKQTDGEAMVIRRGRALSHVLNRMGIFIRDYEGDGFTVSPGITFEGVKMKGFFFNA